MHAVSAPQIAAQIQQESSWNPTLVSSAGAKGIAQFRPATFAVYGRPDAPGPPVQSELYRDDDRALADETCDVPAEAGDPRAWALKRAAASVDRLGLLRPVRATMQDPDGTRYPDMLIHPGGAATYAGPAEAPGPARGPGAGTSRTPRWRRQRDGQGQQRSRDTQRRQRDAPGHDTRRASNERLTRQVLSS